MRLGFTSSMAALLAGAGLVLAQSPGAAPTTQPSPAPAPALSPVPAKSAAVPATMDMPEPTFGYNPTLFSTGCSGGCGVPTTPTESCYPYYRCWGSADYLLWTIQHTPTSPFQGQQIVGLVDVFSNTTATTTHVTTVSGIVTNGVTSVPFGPTVTLTVIDPPVVQPQRTAPTDVLAGLTTTIPGGDSAVVGEHGGAQFTIGTWLDPEQCCGVEARYFNIERRTAYFTQDTGNVLVQPTPGHIFSVALPPLVPPNVGPANAQVLLGQVSGIASVALGNEMWGAEANACHRLCFFGSMVIDGFCGFRYIDFKEAYETNETIDLTFPANVTTAAGGSTSTATVTSSTLDGITTITNTTITNTTTLTTTDTVVPGTPPVDPAHFEIFDRISVRNQFWGGQIGGNAEWYYGKFFVGVRAQVAIGGMHETVDILSQTISPVGGTNDPLLPPHTPVVIPPSIANGGIRPGGLLSGPADQGRHTRNRFSIIPETNIQVGCQLTSCLRCFVGWDYIYFNHIARPTNQTQLADTTINVQMGSSSVSVPVRTPLFRFTDGNMWTSGATMGFEVRF